MSAIDKTSVLSWQSVLTKILRPVARFALRHGLKVQDLTQALTQVLIDEACEELKSSGITKNISRISVMTGVHRKEVSSQIEKTIYKHNVTLIGKVIGTWQHARKYQDSQGDPIALTIGFDDSDFNRLVRSVSKELNPASVLFDLERTGSVELTDKFIKLKKGSYTPPKNFEVGIDILAADIGDMIVAVEENLTGEKDEKNLHARTVFDALRIDKLCELKNWVKQEGHEFHKKVREKFSEYDQDINPEIDYQGPKARVIVGSFSRIEEE
jgi:Family of unknown function (DUF6502)